MQCRIFNIRYETVSLAYPVATVSDRGEGEAVQRLEDHLIKNDSMKGKHLNFKAVGIIDTGVNASRPEVLNSHIIVDRKGELDY